DVQVLPAVAEADPPGRTPLPFRLDVRPGGCEIIDYGEHDRVEPGVPHPTAARPTNGRPVVAERVTPELAPAADGGERCGGDAGDVDGAADADRDGGEGLPPPALTAGPGAAVAAARWWLPRPGAAGDPDGGAAVAVVLNPGRAPVEVRLARWAGGAPASSVRLAPGARAEIPLGGGPHGAGALGVVGDGPVVVE